MACEPMTSGKCRCGRELTGEFKLCETCREGTAARRQALKANGKCGCGRELTGEYKKCETCRERAAASERANPQMRRAQSSRRRAKKRGNGSNFKASDEARMWKAMGKKPTCPYCQQPLDRRLLKTTKEGPLRPQKEHFFPIDAGGPDIPINVVWAHAHCNQSKGASVDQMRNLEVWAFKSSPHLRKTPLDAVYLRQLAEFRLTGVWGKGE